MENKREYESKTKIKISAIIVIFIIIINAIIKFIVLSNKAIFPIEIINNIFNLIHYENVMQNLATFVLTYTIVFIVIIRFLIKKKDKNSMKVNVALAMVLGGGIGNVIDAIIGGSITDYLEIKGLPIMNLDDIIMILGCILFIIFIIIDLVKNNTKIKETEK